MMGPLLPVRVVARGRVQLFHPDDYTAVTAQDVIDEWLTTFVSKYNLPRKLASARKRGAVKVAVPVETLEALIARVELARAKGVGSVQVGVGNLADLLGEMGVAA